MGELIQLKNIGTELERQLNEAHIETAEQLREMGSEKAWLMIRQKDPSACLHRLYALEGAIQGIAKKDLDSDRKQALKDFFSIQ